MSLDKIRQQLEERKRAEQIKLVQEEERKKRRKENKQIQKSERTEDSPSLQGNIGSLSISFSQELLNRILSEVWELDNSVNTSLDSAIYDFFAQHPVEIKMPIDKRRFFTKIRNDVFFVLNSGKRMKYEEIRMTWQAYCGHGMDIDFKNQRKEFVQLFTNRFKAHWVDGNGFPLSEGLFQLLYRIEREPKAIDRIFDFIDDSYPELINEQELRTYLTHLRFRIAKIIKEELLTKLKEPIKEPKQEEKKL